MQHKFATYIFLLVMLMAANTAISQQGDYFTKVKLKDGSILEGKLTEYVDGEYIKMDVGENEITIKQSSIKYIKHKNRSATREYTFPEKGFYHHSSLGILPGFISSGNPVLGLNIDHSSGYLFNRFAGAGINIGVMNYDPLSSEVIYSLAGEFRGYLLKEYISPYYLLRSGYGFAFAGENSLEADGGFFLNPALGIRLTGNKGVNVTVELGVSFQNAHFVQETQWWDRSIIEKDIRYQRINMKLGILF